MKRDLLKRVFVGALALLAALAVPGASAQERVLVEAEAIGASPYKQMFFIESGVIPEGRTEGTVLEANAGMIFVRMGPREQDLLRLNTVGDDPVRFKKNDHLILERRTGSASMARTNETGSTSTPTTAAATPSTTSTGSSVASSSTTSGTNRASASSTSSPSQPTQTTASSSYRSTTDTSSQRADRLPATASWLPLLVLAGVGSLLLALGVVAWRRLN